MRPLVLALLIPIAAVAACRGGGPVDPDADADGDADGDLDGDVDADADGDADGDAGGDADEGSDGGTTARVLVVTSMGEFVVGLYGDDGPVTVANFLAYVERGAYDGTIFHRVIPDFMVQGGGYDEAMTLRPTDPPIELETISWLRHEPGVLSMARTSDPDSATNQFFVCVAASPHLDGQYAAFGRVLEGYDVVEAISLVATRSTGGMDDVPVTPVVIESISRI